MMSNYAPINPATGDRVAEFASLTDEDVRDVLTNKKLIQIPKA